MTRIHELPWETRLALVGNACPACRASLRIEPDPIDEAAARRPHEDAHGGRARDPGGGGR